MTVTYDSDFTYTVDVNGNKYRVSGELDKSNPSKTVLKCDVDGVKTSANVVLNGDSLHLFTAVSGLDQSPHVMIW